jgi:SAM-dependent methyltransferase
MSYRELVLGCGYRRDRLMDPCAYQSPLPMEPAPPDERWRHVVRVDINPACDPDYVMDLEKGFKTLQRPKPNDLDLFKSFGDVYFGLRENTFDEVHAYEVLEHLGHQGNVTEFFDNFDEIWHVLKPGGWLCATVPSRYSMWLWGDPGHRRVILPASLTFLCRPNYDQWLSTTPMSDYRDLFRGDWDLVHSHDNEESHMFVLQAVKPARPPAI